MKKLISKLLTIVMMASIIINTIYASANAKEVVTRKVEEKPQYKRIYDFNKQRKAVDDSSKEVSKNEVVETEVIDNNSSVTAEGDNSTSHSNNENSVLNIPTELRTIETSDSIVLIWNSVANGKGYELEVDGEVKDCGNKTLFVHSNIKDSNTHKYRVRAKNGELRSEWSSYIEKSKKLEIIAMIENIVNVPGENSIKISWNRVSSASEYDIEVDGVIKDIGKSTNYIHEALEGSTSHTYKVRAKKGDNYGQWSKVITVTTLPKKDIADKDNNGVKKGGSTSQVVNKKVEKQELKDANTDEVVTQSTTQTKSSAGVKMLAAATTTTEVQVSNTLGVEDIILTLPLNIAVEPTNNTLLVHWDKVEGAKGYDIEVDGKTIVGSIDTFYQSSNLLSGTQHTYRVRAKDDTKTGEWSQVITGTTLAEDIIVKSSITLTSDRTFTSLNLTAGTINLNGFKLTVVGDLLQSGGTINIAGGELIVGKNYNITGSSTLKMIISADHVLVNGNFEISSNTNQSTYLTDGIFEVKGNLMQKQGAGTYGTLNFNQSGNFKVKLCGEKEQIVTITNVDYSIFNILDISESNNVIFASEIKVKKIRGLNRLGSDQTLVIKNSTIVLDEDLVSSGNIKLVGGSIDLNKHKLTISENLIQIDNALNINGGELIVGKNYNITGSSTLKMIISTDHVLVKGNFEISSNNNLSTYLTNGIFEVKGNLTQKQGAGTYGTLNFNQGGSFTVKLSGEKEQIVAITNVEYSIFNILDISESNNVIFASEIKVKKIRGLNRLGSDQTLVIKNSTIVLDEDIVSSGNIKLVGGSIDLNKHKLTISENLIQIDNSLNINGGELIVGKNYNITGSSTLKMIISTDHVLVNGNFEISSNTNQSTYLTDGIFEVKGNLTQKQGAGTYGTLNFNQGGSFTVKLSGEQEQIVNITNVDYSIFNILNISESNYVIFASEIRVNKIRGLNGLGSDQTLIIKNSNIVLDEDLVSSGNIKLVGGSIDLNKHKLTISENLIQIDNTLNINGGELIVRKNYNIIGDSFLNMIDAACYVLVEGNFEISSSNIEMVGTWNPLSSKLVVGGSLKLVSGTINLNGNNLTILGDLTQIDATISLSGGKLIVGRNYNITGNSFLSMRDEACYVLVEGDFEISSNNDELNHLKGGILEIKGGLTQKSLNYSTSSKCNFAQGTSFIVKLSGQNEQIVNITDYSYSSFNILDMSESNGVIFLSSISARRIIGWDKVRNKVLTLDNSYLNIFSNEVLNCSLNQIGGSINLNGNTFTILGNLNQDGSDIKINGGQLIVEKDYTISNSSHLSMINVNDNVLVLGNFETSSSYSEKGYLTEGILEIKGNVIAVRGSNFYQDGNFRVRLTGDNVQTVMVTGEESSPFNILDISKSSGVIFLSGIKVNKIIGLNKLSDGITLKIIDSNITLEKSEYAVGNIELVGGILNLNRFTFSVSGNLTQIDETIFISGGILAIGKNYTIDGCSILNMTNSGDYVWVKQNFETQSDLSELGYLTYGILCIEGDFKQGGNSSSFIASGDHTVIFNGNKVQSINFTNPTSSDFSVLIVNNLYGVTYVNEVKVTIFTILGNFFLGVGDGATDAAADLLGMITNPGRIVEGVKFLLQCLVPGGKGGEVLDLIANTVKETIFKFGDSNGNVRARMAGKLVGEVVVGLVADKGVGTALQYLKGTFLLKVNSALENGGTLSNVRGYIDDVAVAAAEIVIKIREAIKTSTEALNNIILKVYSRTNGQVDLEFAGYSRITLDETEILENADEICRDRYAKFIESKLAEAAKIADEAAMEMSNEVIVRHAVTNPGAAQSVIDGINPLYFNPASRFGGGFYVAEEGETIVAELAAHDAQAAYSIRFDMDVSKATILDLKNTTTAAEWQFSTNATTAECQAIAQKAQQAGYNVISWPSFQTGGTNYVIYNNFEEILKAVMISPVN